MTCGTVTELPPRVDLLERILRELVESLHDLLQGGQERSLDLRTLPLTGQERQILIACLGVGEVEARVRTGVAVEVRSTAFAGLWWVREEAPDGSWTHETLEVCRVPTLLEAHPADVERSVAQLRSLLPDG